MKLRSLLLLLAALAAVASAPRSPAQDLPVDKPNYGTFQRESAPFDESVVDFVWQTPANTLGSWSDGTKIYGTGPSLDWPPKGPNSDVLKGFTVDHGFDGGTGYTLVDPAGTTIASYKCLPPGTRVRTPLGTRAIESLGAGDLVLGRAGAPVRVRARTVTRAYDEGLVVLESAGETARLTPNHPVLVRRASGAEWVRADALARGDLVVAANGSSVLGLPLLFGPSEELSLVDHVAREPYRGPVFNLVVEGGAYALETGVVHDVTAR